METKYKIIIEKLNYGQDAKYPDRTEIFTQIFSDENKCAVVIKALNGIE